MPKSFINSGTPKKNEDNTGKATAPVSNPVQTNPHTMSADTYKKYEQSYKQYKKTGKYGDTSWMKQDEVDLFNNIRQGNGKSVQSNGTYYYMDNDTYDKYGRSRSNWKATGDYGDTSWMNQNDLDAFNAIRGSRSKQDNDFDDFRYSLNDDIIKSVQDKYRSQWGDKYYYDITDMDDVARMNAGQMPKYLAQKYKDDPYDRWLYENNLPTTKDFNDMYSQAVLDYNEQQQTRSGQLQNIINSLDQYDQQRAAFLQGQAQGKTAEEMLATGDYELPGDPGAAGRDTNHVILFAKAGSWCEYAWWTDRREAPDFANHVDIHNKPGYDPRELFLFNRGVVRGTHGRSCAVAQSE